MRTNDPESVAYAWKVTSMSPAAGTMHQSVSVLGASHF